MLIELHMLKVMVMTRQIEGKERREPFAKMVHEFSPLKIAGTSLTLRHFEAEEKTFHAFTRMQGGKV